jgi:hypothetical protein
MRVKIKNQGQKKEKSKPAALKPKAAAPHERLRHPPFSPNEWLGFFAAGRHGIIPKNDD